MVTIGERAFEYRGKHGMTQEKFAKLAGISLATLNKLENSSDTKIQAGTKGKIEKVLSMGSQDILCSSHGITEEI